jgi:hypothetical protein
MDLEPFLQVTTRKGNGRRRKRVLCIVDPSGCEGFIDPPIGDFLAAIDALRVHAEQHLHGGDQAVLGRHRPARGHRPRHHGPPVRRADQPEGAGPAGPGPGPPQDHRAGARTGRDGVLHRRARCPAQDHAGTRRPAHRRDRRSVRGDPAAAGPVSGAAPAGRIHARLGPPLRPGRRRRDRRRHDQSPPAATCPAGPGRPRWTTSPASAPAGPGTRKPASTWPPSPARPPSRPARPPPAKAPATAS